MGNIKTPNSGLRGRYSAGGSIGRPRSTNGYNHSALALEFPDISFPNDRPQPVLLSNPAGRAANAPMFSGLDPGRRRRGSGILAFLFHLLVAFALLWWTTHAQTMVVQPPDTAVVVIPYTLYDPPPPPVMTVAKVQGGGGAGAHRLVAPSRQRPPAIAKVPPIIQPEAAKIEVPKLPVEPSVQVKLPQGTAIPKLGVPQSQHVTMASQGTGGTSGFGFGLGGGVGQGHSDGGYGGGVMNVGGGVSAPQVTYSVEPQFTEEARQANYQGVVSIQLVVDSQGRPQDIHVVRHLGMGLDERAIEAVRQYRFRPAMYQGRPVAVQMIVNLDFRLH